MQKSAPLTTEYPYLTEHERRAAAEFLLFKCGIRSKYKGFSYLADAVLIYAFGETASFGNIYDAVARFRGKTVKSVFRDLSYAVDNSHELGARLAELSGATYSGELVKPSTAISILGRHLSYMRSGGTK